MLMMIVSLGIFALMNVYCYRRISRGFDLSPRKKSLLAAGMTALLGIYPAFEAIRILFSINIDFLRLAGGIIWLSVPRLFALCFLEQGLSTAYPQKKRRWLTLVLVLYAAVPVHILTLFPPERVTEIYDILRGNGLGTAVLAGLFAALYKIIINSLGLPPKNRGWVIVLFSGGGLLVLSGIGAGGLTLFAGIYAAIYARIASGLDLSPRTRRLMIWIFCIGFVAGIQQMTLWGNGLGVKFLYYFGGFWFGLFLLSLCIFLVEGLTALAWKSHPRLRTGLALLCLFLAAGYAAYNGSQAPQVKRITIPIKNLPAQLEGFTIAQWSDLHLGDMVSPGWLEQTVKTTNRLKPDLLVISGDLIDRGIGTGEPYIPHLKKLEIPHGVYAVTGNHEYYGNRLPRFLELTKKAGIRVLRNQSVTIAGGIQLAGVNDGAGSRFNDAAPDMEAVLGSLDREKPIIFLDHSPRNFPETWKYGIDLQLSGHTHAGQIPPATFFNRIIARYPYGLFREGDAYLYTTSGTGLWGIPMRLFSNNEIALFTLVRE